jgi:hypothetical protein
MRKRYHYQIRESSIENLAVGVCGRQGGQRGRQGQVRNIKGQPDPLLLRVSEYLTPQKIPLVSHRSFGWFFWGL